MVDESKRRALRHAIAVMAEWRSMVPLAFNGKIPEDIEVLKEMLQDVRQLPLPMEKKH